MKIISVLRTTPGLDEFPLFKYLSTFEFDYMNFDDRIYVNHEVFGFYQRLNRAMLRSSSTVGFNKLLQQYILTMKPHIFLYFKAASINYNTIAMANKLGCETIGIYPDLDPSVHGSEYLKAIKYTKKFYHTKPNHADYYNSLNVNSRILGPIYDEGLASSIQEPDLQLGVTFVGHHSAGKQKFLSELSSKYSGTITIFGERWQKDMFKRASANVVVHPSIYGVAVQEVYRRSLCVLGLLQERISKNVGGDEITARTIQVPIYGGLLLHPKTKQADRVFSYVPEILYDSVQDLLEMIYQLQRSPQMRLDLFSKQTSCASCHGTGAKRFIQGLTH